MPYIGNVPLNQLSGQTVDKMFQDIIDKGLKPSTAGGKRVLSVALNNDREYHFIESNAARDTLTEFGKGDKPPAPYTPEQVRVLMERVAGTEWEMPICKPNGAPQAANWISSGLGKLLADLDMPHIRYHDLRHPYVKATTKNI